MWYTFIMQFLIDIGLSLVYLCAFLLICAWAWRFWMMYINQKFLDKFNSECILLEIKLPREIMKSPLATEVALASLLQAGGIGHWYAKKFQGNLPQYASLEIASLEGVLHFYIRIHKKFKELVEANFYAQYPGIEIIEADDYTKIIRYHHLSKDTKTWSASYALSKKWAPTNPETGKSYSKSGKEFGEGGDEYKMPADFLPIKTYVDYGLDKDPKEELKTDPITPLLEFMGNIQKGEYFWYQVLVQDESVYDKKMPKFYVNEQTHKRFSLADMVKERKKQIRTGSWNIEGKVVASEFGVPTIIESFNKKYEQQFREEKDKDGKTIKIPIKVLARYLETKPVSKKEVDLTIEDKEEIEAINKKLSKPLALVVVRLVYVTKSHNFNGNNIQNILSFPKPYKGINSFGLSTSDPYDFPWEKRGGRRVEWRAEEIFDAYVEREGFFPHINERKALDSFEDEFFYPYTMKTRKIFRMIVETIFYPFEHPEADKVSIMNLEEIATLWHLPGQVAGTPTLPRIDSLKGNAPSNLPM